MSEPDARESALAFYTGKANSHASFVVAGMFGMYSILSLFTNNYWYLWFSAYVALVLFDLYAFANFAYYGKSADFLRTDMDRDNKIGKIIEHCAETERGFFLRIRSLRDFMDRNECRKYLILAIIWIFSVIVPLLVRLLTLN
jgi:hypothetical protein